MADERTRETVRPPRWAEVEGLRKHSRKLLRTAASALATADDIDRLTSRQLRDIARGILADASDIDRIADSLEASGS